GPRCFGSGTGDVPALPTHAPSTSATTTRERWKGFCRERIVRRDPSHFSAIRHGGRQACGSTKSPTRWNLVRSSPDFLDENRLSLANRRRPRGTTVAKK